MVIVNTVHMIILVMPAKCAKEASKVQPWDIDPINANFYMSQHAIFGVGDVVQIPIRFLVVLLCAKLWLRQFLRVFDQEVW